MAARVTSEPEAPKLMRAFRHRSPAAFLARAEPWLMRAEVENNVILGLAAALRPRRSSPPPWLLTVEQAGEVVACALRTPPRGLLLTRAAPDALECLLAELAPEAGALPSAIGPEPTAGDFARLWSVAYGRPACVRVRQRLYELRRVTGASPAAGRLRPAVEADFDTVRRWVAAFLGEAAPNDPTSPEELARERVGARSLFLWEDGAPVSMAGSTGRTTNGQRVSLVYTPPAARGRGYATACVAAMSARLLAAGSRYCCLYADLANPISNAIYQRIGYRPLGDAAEYELGS
jgi:hypothetical protein